jgi:hypothetical protein
VISHFFLGRFSVSILPCQTGQIIVEQGIHLSVHKFWYLTLSLALSSFPDSKIAPILTRNAFLIQVGHAEKNIAPRNAQVIRTKTSGALTAAVAIMPVGAGNAQLIEDRLS